MASVSLNRGILYGLASAGLFGMSTPLAKTLVGSIAPLMLAGLLYAGAGLGLLLVLLVRRGVFSLPIALPSRGDLPWLIGAILLGGILGPVALMYGLRTTPASSASLLLNLEAVLTALLAWFLFRENFDRRIALGMLAIVAGGVVLAWSPVESGGVTGAMLIAAACLFWAVDNNLTRKVSTSDAVLLASLKGVIAGTINTALAMAMGLTLPPLTAIAFAGSVGFLGYGVSLALFVLALRELGTARAGAYFSVAPFFGALVAIVLNEDAVTFPLVAAGGLMALGVWLHLTERHSHMHVHQLLEHTHAHSHDEHHQHDHGSEWDGAEPHVHLHGHEQLEHAHAHYPEAHHRHVH